VGRGEGLAVPVSGAMAVSAIAVPEAAALMAERVLVAVVVPPRPADGVHPLAAVAAAAPAAGAAGVPRH